MTWDDNWVRALVTIGAAAIGAIIASVINAYAAKLKVREVELNYAYRLRDGYLENARKLTGDVYIPISVAITELFKGYERFVAKTTDASEELHKQEEALFEEYCESYLGKVDDLFARGADAYLTNALDELLNDFTNFVRNSLRQQSVHKRIILQTKFNVAFIKADPEVALDYETKKSWMRLPNFSLGSSLFGFSLSYKEKVISAPAASNEFERRIRTEVPQLKALIKEVTHGSRTAE